MVRVMVVGGGAAGLSAAWHLRRAAPARLGLDVQVVEAAPVPGGKTCSIRAADCVFEWGPHGILDNAPHTLELISELGLGDRLLESRSEARHRHILHQGRLKEVPSSPGGILKTDLMPLAGRLRLLTEPFRKKRVPLDESIAEFAARRLGKAVIPALLEPFVTGVYAGDVNALSLRSCFPLLYELERDHGSLLRGMLARAKQRKARGEPRRSPTLCSFKTGLGELTEALAASLGDGYRGATRVTQLRREGAGYRLELEGAGTERADVLVLALPAPVARPLLEPVDEDLAANLATIPHAGVAVVCATFPRERVRHSLESFGFLCARAEERRILGCIFASSVFAGHAPAGLVSLRALLGGVFRPELATADEDRIAAVALEELDDLLGLTGEPESVHVFRHDQALPQYNLGHTQRLAAVDDRLRFLPDLYLTGAAFRGVSVNDCILSGRRTAESILRRLAG